MEGLKPMADKAMSTKDMALHDAKAMVAKMGGTAIVNIGDDDEPPACDQCGKWIEPGNTGTVCGACAQSMLGMSAGAAFKPLSAYADVNADTTVGLHVNGHNLSLAFFRSLRGLADDIRGSMTPDEIRVLVRLLAGPPEPSPYGSSALPDSFWEHVKGGRKIQAIKDLRSASTLNLLSSKNIVDALMDKSDDKDESKGEPDKDDDGQGDDEPGDPEGNDDSGDEPEESDSGEPGDGDTEEGDSEGEGEVDASEAGSDGGELDSDSGTATAEAIADLARKAHDNGKEHSEDEIRKALETLGIQF